MSKLKTLRKSKCLSQSELAELSGISQQYISDIETGRVDGSLAVLRKLARALSIGVTRLIEDNLDKKKGA